MGTSIDGIGSLLDIISHEGELVLVWRQVYEVSSFGLDERLYRKQLEKAYCREPDDHARPKCNDQKEHDISHYPAPTHTGISTQSVKTVLSVVTGT